MRYTTLSESEISNREIIQIGNVFFFSKKGRIKRLLSVSIFSPNLGFKKYRGGFSFLEVFLLPPLVCGLRADLVLQIKNSCPCALTCLATPTFGDYVREL